MPWRRMGEWMYRSTFLDRGTSWRWVVSFTRRPLYTWGNSPRYPLDRRLAEFQSRSELHGEAKILDVTEIRTPIPRSSSQSLYRLRQFFVIIAVLILHSTCIQNIFYLERLVSCSKLLLELDNQHGAPVSWYNYIQALRRKNSKDTSPATCCWMCEALDWYTDDITTTGHSSN
jgi:hypothetical protein